MSDQRKIRFALVVHNHQPVGNPDEIIERIYQTAYYPFIEKLSAVPEVKANLHYTGFLLEWLENHHPDFIVLLRELVDRGQIEIMGGAYYEPIISVIPDSDARGQTNLLSNKIRELFGVNPTGFWTAERAWEPNLPEILASVRADYTVIDDVSFESSGLDESRCFEPYLLESRGNFVTVFPISKKLRYFMPFKPVATTIQLLRKAAKEGFKIALYGDDGEKFGAWPDTFDRVYKEGWLESFFRIVEKQDWIETVKLSEYLKSNPATKRDYLPASTYNEMMDWSIPLNNQSRKVRRNTNEKNSIPLKGFWRMFLAKYPESANIYSKMLRVSKNIHSLDDSSNKESLVELWKGQCNDAYWHGVFGGLYAPTLRRITYEHLIRANVGLERLRSEQGKNWIYLDEKSDGGIRDIYIETEHLGLTISPSSGGSISELDFKPGFANVLDTLARRPERYHKEIKKSINRTIVPDQKKAASIHDSAKVKQRGLEKLLIYDRHPKYAFIDYFLDQKDNIRSFEKQYFRELENFADTRYEAEIQKSNLEVAISMACSSAHSEGFSVNLKKIIHVPADNTGLRVDYQIELSGSYEGTLSGLFVPEINLGSLSDKGFTGSYGKSMTIKSEKVEISYEVPGFRISINAKGANSSWIVPVKTVSLSERGFESNLQGISVLPNYNVELIANGEPFKTSIELQTQSS